MGVAMNTLDTEALVERQGQCVLASQCVDHDPVYAGAGP